MSTAHADDPAKPADIAYSTKMVDTKDANGQDTKTVVSALKNGTFELAQQDGATPDDPKQTVVNVKDTSGATVMSFPLDFKIAGTNIPVKSDLKNDNTVLEVTPDKPAAAAPVAQPMQVQPVPVLKDIASPLENQRAMNDFSTKFGLAVGIGSFVGTAVGAVIGCVVTFVAGCIPGLVAGAGIGGILGTIGAGGPTLIAAGIDLLQTMQAPDGTTKWADANMN
ncbi:hypothetical protein ACIP5Y_45675 [Nocardia sp. NPDC088792]|uniref:hypothetical protein n=1 Tax=Nocardia sp. NPDC088792 TaxID=3364332 RepID=UPI00382491BD